MVRSAFVSSVFLFCVVGQAKAAPLQSGSSNAGPASAVITLPQGTRVELTVTNAVWAKTAKAGDPLYTQSNFPVTIGNGIAVPAGTYVQGRIEAITRPTRRSGRAELRVLFTKIIFANGYTVAMPDLELASAGQDPASPAATAATLTVGMSPANDLLLDNGAQAEMTLAAPLALDASQVAKAIPLTHALEPGKFRSATLCRPTPGSPGTSGTPDTVIPGSPGTPSITIPGGPGLPDTVIPGIAATPDTVSPGIPGTPGTEGSVCPAAPIVVSSVPFAMTPVQRQSSIGTIIKP